MAKILVIGGRSDKCEIDDSINITNPDYKRVTFTMKNGAKKDFYVDVHMDMSEAEDFAVNISELI